MPIYLSIDVATKSLAIGLYQIESESIIPLAMNVYDLDSEKKSKEMSIDDKAKSLKLILNSFDKFLPNTTTSLGSCNTTTSLGSCNTSFEVLIEYQMNVNYMSNAIFNMIVYHYADRVPIHTVFPSLKNSIYLHKNLKLSDFLATANANYIANKNHCKYNFLYFIILFEYGNMIKNIKQKNIDDIADTFMQCLAFHRTKQSKLKD